MYRNKVLEFFYACFISAVCFIAALGLHGDRTSQPHVEISSALAEYKIVPNRRGPELRFRLEGQVAHFKIDSSLFRDAMQAKVPEEFVIGAPVIVQLSTEEYAHPTPLYGRDSDPRVVWVDVHSLNVAGKQIFDLVATSKWDLKYRYWSYPFLVIAIGLLLFAIIRFNRS